MAAHRICTIPDCGKRVVGNDLCDTHYRRWKRKGDPLAGGSVRAWGHHGAECSIDGCDKPSFSRGLCSGHYERWRDHGDPLRGGTANGEPLRFLEEIVMAYDGDDCLLWPYGNSNGYGEIWIDGSLNGVHRIVCERVNGPRPDGQEATHSCGNGGLGCVTKGHLLWKTHIDNMADTLVHGTRLRGERVASAKLTKAQVREIRASPAEAKSLAERLGVTPNTIRRIRRRERWSWLE